MKAYRIEHDRHLATSRSGEGARLAGARWNSRGLPMVYAAENLSLSVLEILVHAEGAAQRRARRSKATIDIPDGLIATLGAAVPKGFSFPTSSELTQPLGDAWLQSGQTPALRVPSSVVSTESIILLNPRHPDYSRCVWSGFTPIELDPRLWAV